MIEWYHWAAFLAAIVVLLSLDLGVAHRRSHVVALREALGWTVAWVAVAAGFAGLLWAWLGGQRAGEFLAGYLIEWSLSVDNVFVFVLVFAHFAVPAEHQHRVLFWGVVGAIGLRLGFILAGAALLERFHWVVFVFGGVLLLTAVRFVRGAEGLRSVEHALPVRVIRRILPMTDGYRGQRLSVRENGRHLATPLLAVLMVIEASDLVFAVDSIPAVLAVTRHTFVAFASNALAILGLRSLYFVLSSAVGRFRYLRPALAVLLAFVGLKMLASSWIDVPVALSLGVIVAILGGGVVASAIANRLTPRRAARTGSPG
jgi:tellurite resistance protein TerC